MDAVARSRGLLLTRRTGRTRPGAAIALAAVGLAGAAACAAQDAGSIGVSPPRAVEHRSRADAGPDAAVPSPVPADFRETMAKLGDRFPSRGHADQFDALLWANDGALAAWTSGGDAADGAMFVEEALPPGTSAAGEASAGLLVMEKRGGAWTYAIVNPGADVWTDDRVAPCATCHRDAPRDSVFRMPVPRSAIVLPVSDGGARLTRPDAAEAD